MQVYCKPVTLFSSLTLYTMSLFVMGCRVDDVEDNSQLRRGAPVAHKIYGVPQTINSANYVYFLAFQELSRLKDLLKGDEEVPASKQPDLVDRMVTGTLQFNSRFQLWLNRPIYG